MLGFHFVVQCGFGVLAATGGFILGTVIGWTSPIQHKLMDGDYEFVVSADEMLWLASIFTLGAAAICLPVGFTIDIIGRKLTMLLCLPFVLIGWICLAIAENVSTIYAGRFILGVGSGAFSIIIPIYTTEIAQTVLRGYLGAFFQMAVVLGILFSFLTGFYLSVFYTIIACAIVPCVSSIFFIVLPESPVYLMMKDKIEKAHMSLQSLRGEGYDLKHDFVEIVIFIQQSKENPSFCKSIRQPPTSLALFYTILLMLFQQFSGISAVMFYTMDIFDKSKGGMSTKNSMLLVGIVQSIATFIAIYLMDLVGRRIPLLISSFLMSIIALGIGLYFFILERDAESASHVSWMPVFCFCSYVGAFSFGLGPIPWLTMAEVFSQDVKGFTVAVCCTINWLASFVVTNQYKNIINLIGVPAIFWAISALMLICFFFVLFCLPETRSRSFRHVHEKFELRKL
ncbi:facilitated trehalose transporter Tret1 [Glossina fuscipes fuscipes]